MNYMAGCNASGKCLVTCPTGHTQYKIAILVVYDLFHMQANYICVFSKATVDGCYVKWLAVIPSEVPCVIGQGVMFGKTEKKVMTTFLEHLCLPSVGFVGQTDLCIIVSYHWLLKSLLWIDPFLFRTPALHRLMSECTGRTRVCPPSALCGTCTLSCRMNCDRQWSHVVWKYSGQIALSHWPGMSQGIALSLYPGHSRRCRALVSSCLVVACTPASSNELHYNYVSSLIVLCNPQMGILHYIGQASNSYYPHPYPCLNIYTVQKLSSV